MKCATTAPPDALESDNPYAQVQGQDSGPAPLLSSSALRNPQPLVGRQLAPLTLQPERALTGPCSRVGHQVVLFLIRVLPAFVIYGGTLALLVCVFFKYRWGVLLSLLLYTVYMFINSWELVVFGARGLVLCWFQGRRDWYALYCKTQDREAMSPVSCRKGNYFRDQSPMKSFGSFGSLGSDRTPLAVPSAPEPVATSAAFVAGGDRALQWQDVFHVVMVPTYKTPPEVLQMSLGALENFGLARTNLAVCLAFEEREEGSRAKFQKLKQEYEGRFCFITAAFHPPDLPNHVPGKSSNECWAFSELLKELRDVHGFEVDDPRVIITVIDDDSELHPHYFEALTYHFLEAPEAQRYLTLWQPPIVHFKNYLTQPLLVRLASLFTSLHELACLANPLDSHVPFSSYSISLVLAASVGGWDPDFISEDWHMMAKCALKTEGRAKCKPIFLPLMNYAPEEETWWGTIKSRWTQATRHALGVSEIVYVVSNTYLGAVETGSCRRAISFIWRMLPTIGKFISVHFVVGTLAIWPMLSHILINFYMWQSWCDIDELHQTCATCCVALSAASDTGVLREERVILNSWVVYFQQKANAGLALGLVLAGGFGAIYFHLVRDRVDGNVAATWVASNPLLLWIRIQLEVACFGWISSLAFASLPEWIAVVRIVVTLRFHHVVAGMVGRGDDEDEEQPAHTKSGCEPPAEAPVGAPGCSLCPKSGLGPMVRLAGA